MIVITGPSGAGKGTLIRALLERISDLELAVSATTRLQRSGEEDGREYYFLSDGEFAHRVARGDFLEHVTYVSGQRYGTLRSEVERIAAKGEIAVLELETEGALNVAEEMPAAVTIFVTAPVERARAAAARAGDGERGRDRGAARPRGEPAHAGRLLRPRGRERRARARRRGAGEHRPQRAGRCGYHARLMISPRIDALLDNVDSRYALVIVAAKRARQINNYHHQLGEGTFDELPPLVESRSKNYLTMAFEEIAEGKIAYEYPKALAP